MTLLLVIFGIKWSKNETLEGHSGDYCGRIRSLAMILRPFLFPGLLPFGDICKLFASMGSCSTCVQKAGNRITFSFQMNCL